MNALSVKEPWLSRIVDGKKTIETRTWKLAEEHRGKDLLLVGSKSPPGPYAGQAACMVEVSECRPMTKEDEKLALCPVYPGLYSWVLTNMRLVLPVRITGKRGIYQVKDFLIMLKDSASPASGEHICEHLSSSQSDLAQDLVALKIQDKHLTLRFPSHDSLFSQPYTTISLRIDFCPYCGAMLETRHKER